MHECHACSAAVGGGLDAFAVQELEPFAGARWTYLGETLSDRRSRADVFGSELALPSLHEME
jgi:hypothetical protein